MLLLCLRGIIGPKMVSASITLYFPILEINFQNVMLLISVFILINGTIVTFKTAYDAAKEEGEVKRCLMYFFSIMQFYVCLLFILPFTKVYQNLPITCIFVVSAPVIKLCWKFIITSVLKFHFNPFTWDHVIGSIACLFAVLVEDIHYEITVFVMLCAFVVTLYLMCNFAYTTVLQIAEYLKINIFTITEKKNKILSASVASHD